MTFLREPPRRLWLEQWLQHCFSRRGLVVFLPHVDGCARGASRWAVKEGRLAEVGGRGGQLGCASFAFTFSLFLGISRTVMGFGWGLKSDEGA